MDFKTSLRRRNFPGTLPDVVLDRIVQRVFAFSSGAGATVRSLRLAEKALRDACNRATTALRVDTLQLGDLAAAMARLASLSQLTVRPMRCEDDHNSTCRRRRSTPFIVALSAALPALTALESLQLVGFGASTDAGIAALAARLPALSRLTRLDFGGLHTSEGSAGCVALVRAAARLRALRQLFMPACSLGLQGSIAMAHALSCGPPAWPDLQVTGGDPAERAFMWRGASCTCFCI
ncbi:hypothetical protein MNEG_3726 [Monoraphidium neglectum]|uniref:Uncharacterized protein n=1 Tax=Monoraphidium neglectum TaxID=145388 RepID=A0A0D2NGT7_9CHLO|nr:hypothetical protein MNEG_3726 [Monoraphidium neglectum]KIZ04236.1 hypothetical protein MNEG_3726 [Monoraphidium neglectum]|eukprot:XP_013903255.1 hypothetical protein MNEG_3726 [Monoraphidium neglectum]